MGRIISRKLGAAARKQVRQTKELAKDVGQAFVDTTTAMIAPRPSLSKRAVKSIKRVFRGY